MWSERLDRRTVVKSILGTGLISLAGCSGSDERNGTPHSDTPQSTSTPDKEIAPARIESWFYEGVGGEDETYYPLIVDARDQDLLIVDVGTKGNGGFNAFDPNAAIITAGTTVKWVWTGRGGAHNVVSPPPSPVDSDAKFSSGDPIDDAEHTFTYTFDTPGTVRYYCESHLADGMKGALVVEFP